MGCFRYPKNAPTSTRGVEIPSHISKRAKRVPNGTAPEDFWPQMNKFKTKKMPKQTPGYNIAVQMALLLHLVPLNMRKNRAEVYPPNIPMNTKRKSIACMSAPRLAGERNPKQAKAMRMKVDTQSCTPVPTKTESHPAMAGGRNTSPCTSFHPVSSTPSSRSPRSYLWKSRRIVWSMIMPTIPDKKMTIMKEFKIENQCTWASASMFK
mmetsp:Transcript_22864/g.35793  ORF Transcript_22864/g.35793 Transcript_22864/m.35793 type:complete len:208 (+) Transcript_22864:573-1196(+)